MYDKFLSPYDMSNPFANDTRTRNKFMHTRVNFYNPLTGQETALYDNITSIFAQNGINVQLTGSRDSVKKVEALLQINQNTTLRQLPQLAQMKYYAMDEQIPPMQKQTNVPVVPSTNIVPSFETNNFAQEIQFYDPLTGQAGPSINPVDRVTSMYSQNGINVRITGSRDHVQKVEALLNLNRITAQQTSQQTGSNVPQNQTQELYLPQNQGMTYYPMDANISANNFASTQSVTTPRQFNTGNVENVWRFVPNPRDMTKVLLTGPLLQKPFSGSGVIFFERHVQNKPRNEPCVILVKTTRGTFEDFGGELDRRLVESVDTVKHNARKEAFEESAKLFVINNLDLEKETNGQKSYIDLSDVANGAVYRIYYVALSGTESYPLDNLYASNRKIMLSSMPYLTNEYLESVELKRFYLSTLRSALMSAPSGGVVCPDVDGLASTIRDRTANCLRAIINNTQMLTGVFSNPVAPVFSKENNIYSPVNGLAKFNM